MNAMAWLTALGWWIAINVAGATITCIITDPMVGVFRKRTPDVQPEDTSNWNELSG